MSAVAQVANTGSLATPTLRSPSTRRLRPSVAGVADRTALASERVIAELQAKLERVEGENSALKGEVAQLQAQFVDEAAVSEAAMQAQATTIESLTATNADLRGELAEARSTNARLLAAFKSVDEMLKWGLADGVGSAQGEMVRLCTIIIAENLKE